MLVCHADDETIHARIATEYIVIPPNEAVEIVNEHYGRCLLQLKHFHGLVQVNQVKGPRGVSYDIDEALDRSAKLLLAKDQETIRNYVEGQFEDRLKNGKVALPPGNGSRVQKLLRKYNVNLKQDFNLDVNMDSVGVAKAANDTRDAEIAELKAANARMEAMIAQILAGQVAQTDNTVKPIKPPKSASSEA